MESADFMVIFYACSHRTQSCTAQSLQITKLTLTVRRILLGKPSRSTVKTTSKERGADALKPIPVTGTKPIL